MPQAVELDEMLRQLLEARSDAALCVGFGAWQLRRYRDKAYVLSVPNEFDRGLVLPWNGEDGLEWPALNARVSFVQASGQGISAKALKRFPVTLRLRSGGETLRPRPGAATRSLKNLLQEERVPPWRRERLPLLYCGDELACVVGVAVAAGFQAGPGEPGIVVT